MSSKPEDGQLLFNPLDPPILGEWEEKQRGCAPLRAPTDGTHEAKASGR